MPTRIPAVSRVEEAVSAALAVERRLLLAVSGGRDSMVLLDAAARAALRDTSLTVATFDHGTGEAAARAVELVAESAADYGLPCVIGHATRVHRSEAGWRKERWEFLREAAGSEGVRVATAHTRDDQIETVVIRTLRDAGARGLAGLYAPSDVSRPLLEVSRSDVAAYAQDRRVRYAADPTNLSRRHLRNRVRQDLLPALRAVHPPLPSDLLALSRRAADWRAALAKVVDGLDLMFLNGCTIRIAAASLQGYDAAALRILWPEVAARVGVTMDRRGTERAAAFTIDTIAVPSARRETGGSPDGTAERGERGGRGGRGRVIQLSGGAEIQYVGSAFILRRG
jgi:tRNA(Ile)-lysidine synthase